MLLLRHCGALFLVFLLGCSASAQTTTWTNTAGGLWSTGANWSSGIPAAGGIAQFETVTGSYTVTSTGNQSTSQMRVYDGNVTFNLSGTTYNAGLATVGNVAGENGRLTVTNGSMGGSSLDIGESLASTGVVTITTGGLWTVAGALVSVGNGGTATLTINNGGSLVTNAVSLGGSSFGTGTLNLTGVGSTMSIFNLTVGNSGTGTATISGGGVVTNSGSLLVASGGGSTGTMTVTGAGSKISSLGSITVGGNLSTLGSLTVSSGGTVVGTTVTIGNLAAANGSITVTGTNSLLSSGASQMIVGNSGTGALSILTGGSVTAGSLVIGNSAGGMGTMSVSGTNASFTASNSILIGNAGTGAMTIGSGATVTSSSTTISASTGSLTLDGGTLDTTTFTRNGTFNFNDGTLHVRGAYTANPVINQLVINGNDDAALPTLRLSGNFATNNLSVLYVGNTRQGALILDGGRALSLQSMNIAALAGSTGTVTLSGSGTSVNTSSNVDVGGSSGSAGGAGTLNIHAGTGVVTGTLTLHPEGVINLDGTLVANAFNANGGHINFNSGLFSLLSGVNLTSSQLDAILGTSHVFGAGREIDIAGTATFSAPLTISGGQLYTVGITNASTMQIDSGIASATTFTNNAGKLLVITGTGSVVGSGSIVNNGTLQLNDNLVATSGGTLTNAGTIRGTGYIGNNLSNGTAGQVQITAGNRIEFQGASNTNSGLISLNSGELVFTGPITNAAGTGIISGRESILRTGGITNNGSLAFSNGTMDVYGKITQNVGGRITISGGGTANFYDDVTIAPGAASVQASAAGGTVSKVVFFGSYNGGVTGGGTAFIEGDHRPGNSPGLVTFGGDVFYGALSRLFIELGGTTRGSQYDAIDVTGSVTVSGQLNLLLYNGYLPNGGETFLVINNDGVDAINGIFDNMPEGTTFTAGGKIFQISYVGGTGNDLVISAVPEPGTWAMIGLSVACAGGYWYQRRLQKKTQWEESVEG